MQMSERDENRRKQSIESKKNKTDTKNATYVANSNQALAKCVILSRNKLLIGQPLSMRLDGTVCWEPALLRQRRTPNEFYKRRWSRTVRICVVMRFAGVAAGVGAVRVCVVICHGLGLLLAF